jgi:uncharacterized protein (DUF488 family)
MNEQTLKGELFCHFYPKTKLFGSATHFDAEAYDYISYLHLRGLGTPKDGREAARAGKFDALHKIYAAHLKTTRAKEELDELSALVKKSGPVCILCYERDHLHCHRQWIAEIIEDRDGVKVENLVAPQL